jgi:tRNA threonylcarbamoyladenosine biosynthesis protein TsaE
MPYMSTGMIWQTSSTGSGDTERLGELLGKRLKGGEVIELCSDLGGGKTTFVRGLVRGTGSRGHVASPTFTLNRVYQAKDLSIYHYDFYRLDDPGILAGQLAESIADGKAITIVEWADIVQDVLPAERIAIGFKPTAASPDERLITIRYPERFSGVIKELETDYQDSRP